MLLLPRLHPGGGEWGPAPGAEQTRWAVNGVLPTEAARALCLLDPAGRGAPAAVEGGHPEGSYPGVRP